MQVKSGDRDWLIPILTATVSFPAVAALVYWFDGATAPKPPLFRQEEAGLARMLSAAIILGWIAWVPAASAALSLLLRARWRTSMRVALVISVLSGSLIAWLVSLINACHDVGRGFPFPMFC